MIAHPTFGIALDQLGNIKELVIEAFGNGVSGDGAALAQAANLSFLPECL